MEKEKFNFRNYIINKGFKEIDDKTYSFKVSADHEVHLYIDRGDCIIPLKDNHFREPFPGNERQAEKLFDKISDFLEVI
ncbi:hypothetical protein [Chryseobacterium daeguense]|uniref:hypothetical protein n=1 Tax=Chryseobacterium daeguense TaxID=412438 RepID=UPI000410474B|nr:hypothetical protein [Chryseobacterium daeguense]